MTSQLSTEDASILLGELEGGQVNVPDELDTVRENTAAELLEAEGDEVVKLFPVPLAFRGYPRKAVHTTIRDMTIP